MNVKKKIFLWVAGIIIISFVGLKVADEIYLLPRYAFRELRLAIYGYAYENGGKFPPDIQTLLARAKAEGVEPTPTWRHYKTFYYVSGLTTNDVAGVPLLFANPRKKRNDGMLKMTFHGNFTGSTPLFSDMNKRDIELLLNEPWELVRKQFKDEKEFNAFKSRLAVHPPFD